GLNLLGIPHFSDGIVIDIPEGTFMVHQACSGLRFLIASAAFGVLYACLMYRTAMRRTLFIAFSIVAAIVGNWLRVLGIILVAHFIGNAEAIEAGHVLWGWLFYLIIAGVLILVGLPFRQTQVYVPALPARGSNRSVSASVLGLVLILIFTAVPRGFAAYLNRLETLPADAANIERPVLPGCISAPVPAAALLPWVEDGFRVGKSYGYQCNGDLFVLTLRRYPPRVAVRPLFSSLRAAVESAHGDTILTGREIRGPGPLIWRVTYVDVEKVFVAIVTALWLDGRPSGAGIPARIQQAFNSLRTEPVSPMVAVVTYS